MAREAKEEIISNEGAGATQEHIQELAAQSAQNRSAGLPDVEVSLTDTIKVKFKKDFLFMKKDQVVTISQMAYDIYNKKDAVEKV